MEYGKVAHLEAVDFSLPPDDRMTDELLQSLDRTKDQPLQLYVGCARWGNKEWIGKVYPPGTKDKDFLAQYVRQFNTIELNAMFYNLQPRHVIEKWASLADASFRFCPKFSNTISHTRQLQNTRTDTELFISHMQSFGQKLGPSFLQLSDSFGPDRTAILQAYCRSLPRDFKTCVELRHERWFSPHPRAACSPSPFPPSASSPALAAHQPLSSSSSSGPASPLSPTWDCFRDLGIGTVITDTAGRRDALHMRLTAPFAFIRFVGNNLHPTDFPRIDAWVDRIKTWIDKGLREIYFFVHSHEEINSPQLAEHAIAQFNMKCGTRLTPPKKFNEEKGKNLTLF